MKFLRFVICIFILGLLLIESEVFGQNSYYISSFHGNDANSGTSAGAPWQTLSRLEQVLPNLGAGDVVYLERGSAWYETSIYFDRISGSASNPISFRAYGDGPRPIISGGKVLNNFQRSGNIYSVSIYKDFPNVPKRVPTGVLINGKWQDIARSQEYITYGSGSASYLYDGDRNWSANRYAGALLLFQPVHWQWIPTPIISNTNNSLSFVEVEHSASSEQEAAYYLANHDDFMQDPGDWTFRDRVLKVHYPTDLNQQNVQFAVSDSILTLQDCNNIEFNDIVFEMSNVYHISVYKGGSISFNGCEFRFTAGEGIMFKQTEDIHFTNNYVHDCGAVGLRLTWFGYAEVRNNLFKRIATQHVGMANWDFRMGAGLALNYSYSPSYDVEYNYFDSVGLAIQSHTFSNNGSVSIRYNYIEDYGVTISDCGAMYFNSDMGSTGLRYVKNNIIRNARTAGDRYGSNFHPVLHPHAIYCDEGALAYYCDSNTIENTSYALYMNRNYKNTILNCNIVNANQYNPEFYNAVFIKDQAIGPTNFSADRDTIRNNNIVLSNNSNPRVYLRHESRESQATSMDQNLFFFDYNKIADPFHSGEPYIGRYIYHWGQEADYNYTLAQMRYDGGRVSAIPTDAHSVVDPQGIEYASVAGSVSEDDFVKLFTNYSASPRTVNLGNVTFRDIDGNNVSGSVVIPPFYSKILFYASGNIATADPEYYIDSTLIPALVTDENGDMNHAPVINNAEFVINESSFSSEYIGTISVSDVDNLQGHSYAIVAGNGSGLFSINNSGALYFTTSNIDFSGNPQYQLTIRVTDNGTPALSDEATVTVRLIEMIANEAPYIEDQDFEYYAGQGASLFVGSVIAYDPDGDDISFSVLSGDTEILTLTSGGELSFIEEPDVSMPTNFELGVRITDNGTPAMSDDAQITVVYIPLSYAIFIDPTASPGGTGTYNNPYNSFDPVDFEPEYSYLIKRGTVLQLNNLIIDEDNIEIGAYGEGDRPRIQSSSTSNVVFSVDQHDITIKNLVIEAPQALSAIYFIGPESNSILISNCVVSGADYGIRFINTGLAIIQYCEFYNNLYAAYTIGNGSNYFYNLFADNTFALNILSGSYTSKVYNNVFYNNREAITYSGIQLNCHNNIFYLLEESDKALISSTKEVVSDHNIFYPERTGFISLDHYTYNTLQEVIEFEQLDINSMILDPCFLVPDEDNFQLSEHSPAIDAGIYVGLQYDINGVPIPVGDAPDIGITEFLLSQVSAEDTAVDLPENVFWAYPNPASDILFIKSNMELSGKETIRLYNSFGLLIRESRVMENLISPLKCYQDVSFLDEGLYLISISDDEELIGSFKFIKSF